MSFRPVVAIIACLAVLTVSQASAEDCAFRSYVSGPGFKNSVWGLSVRVADTGKELAACNEDKNLVPASILKLFVTAAALEAMGPEYSFKTRLYMDGTISGGTLNGSLYIRGGGDPAFGSNIVKGSVPAKEIFAKWAGILKAAGITGIKGSIVADDSLFEGQALPGSWAWEDIGNYYAAQPTALAVNDNLYKLFFKPGADVGSAAEVLRTEPAVSGLKFQNFMRTGPQGSGDNGYIFNFPEQYSAVLRGTIPKGVAEFAIKGALPDPALFTAQEFSAYLQKEGIKVTDAASRLSSHKNYGACRFLDEVVSVPLKGIVYATNKRSFNLYAEMLMRHIALAKGKPGTADDGLETLKAFVMENGMEASYLKLTDASGLSRLNLVQAGGFSAFLAKISKKNYFGAYLDSLVSPADPDATGHIKRMGQGTKLENFLKIKSGSLSGVRAYAGYLKTKKGRTLAFTSILNNYSVSGPEIDRMHESLLLELIEKY